MLCLLSNLRINLFLGRHALTKEIEREGEEIEGIALVAFNSSCFFYTDFHSFTKATETESFYVFKTIISNLNV